MQRVSVLLATCNSEKYLAELMDSILDGTYEDIKLYVRDDCSQDETRKIIASYDDLRIESAVNPLPSGSAQNNFFRLLLNSEGDYLMFADADDVWKPDKVKRTLAKMQELERAYGRETPLLVHTDLCVVDEKLDVIAPSMWKYEKLSTQRHSLKNMLVQNVVTGCTMMVNRALADMVREQPAECVMHDWWLALVAAAFGKIDVVDEPLMLYRQHGSNQVGAYDASNQVKNAKKLADTQRIRKIYESMYGQARCFAETYRESLTPEQYALCMEFANQSGRTKIGKMRAIVKNGFYKNTLLRNIGQFIAV
ncbi:MAG: glycosyltransferase family 2 protein [Oscillospiraceae bacterium]